MKTKDDDMKNTFLKLVKDPGVLFSAANIFAFSQSGNVAALSIAVATFALAADQCCNQGKRNKSKPRQWLGKVFSRLPSALKGDPENPALRINAYGVLAAGILSLSSGAILPGIAGLAFSTGNFLASSLWSQRIQRNPDIKGAKKVITNPAVHYGVGYAMIGLMAGGGFQLLRQPLHNIPALVTTSLGLTATSLSSVGLALGKFKNPAAPFMTVAFGGIINTMSGVLSGNYQGAVNNLLAICGETRLGQINFHAEKERQAQEKTATTEGEAFENNDNSPSTKKKSDASYKRVDAAFNFVSRQLLRPLEALDSFVERRTKKQAFSTPSP